MTQNTVVTLKTLNVGERSEVWYNRSGVASYCLWPSSSLSVCVQGILAEWGGQCMSLVIEVFISYVRVLCWNLCDSHKDCGSRGWLLAGGVVS